MSQIRPIKFFSGRASIYLAEQIAKNFGTELGRTSVFQFSDGEFQPAYDESVRGCTVFIIQSTFPPGDNLLELLMMVDAAKRASADKVVAVIPYFGYARQDRKDQPRVAVTAKLIADIISKAGADRVITMDLHAAQIQGFFDIPLDHLYASPIYTDEFKDKSENLAVVSPDAGGIKIARSYAKRLKAELVLIDKRRPNHNQAEVMNVIGEVEGKNILIVDDLIDTGGTFVAAISALKKRGAKNIYGAITHPLLSGEALQRIENTELNKLYVTDTIPLRNLAPDSKIQVNTSAELFAEAIIRSHYNESISSLFDVDKS